MTDPAVLIQQAPGIELILLPAPPNFETLCGYRGQHEWVGLYWGAGDELYYGDGQITATGDHQGWLAFSRHIVFLHYLGKYDFGSSDSPARHQLLINRQSRIMYVGDWGAVESYLRQSWPSGRGPNLHISLEEWQELQAAASRALVELPMPTIQELQAMLEAEFQQVCKLVAWLDDYAHLNFTEQCPRCHTLSGSAARCPICSFVETLERKSI